VRVIQASLGMSDWDRAVEAAHRKETGMTVHTVKSWTYLFRAIESGLKTHDIRDMSERDYKVGDHMVLREFDMTNGTYTGREMSVEITYITDNMTPCALSSHCLAKPYGILSVKIIKAPA